ncbi:MAG: hypothetical protein AABX75_02935, partial [Nanoarchaeota archaeon]
MVKQKRLRIQQDDAPIPVPAPQAEGAPIVLPQPRYVSVVLGDAVYDVKPEQAKPLQSSFERLEVLARETKEKLTSLELLVYSIEAPLAIKDAEAEQKLQAGLEAQKAAYETQIATAKASVMKQFKHARELGGQLAPYIALGDPATIGSKLVPSED